MQVQQDSDRLRTVLLKHWLDMSFNSCCSNPLPYHSKECGFWSDTHTHTILVIPGLGSVGIRPLRASPSLPAGTKHLEPEVLDPFKLYRFQSESASFRKQILLWNSVPRACLTHDSDMGAFDFPQASRNST
jgi:hypothetical protein